MQLAASLTGTRLVSFAVACSAAFGLYRAWPDARECASPVYRTSTGGGTSKPTGSSYVPLLGDPEQAYQRAQDTQGAGCAPFIAPLVDHPNWSLQLVDGASGCTGDHIVHRYEVFADRSVLWQAESMPNRVLRLTPTELALVLGTNAFPCGRTDPIGYSFGWMRVAPGGDPDGRGSAVIPDSSLAGGMLRAVMAGAIARYQAARLAAIGPFEVHLTARAGTVRIRIDVSADGHLVVRRGKRVVSSEALEVAERVELYDYLATRVAAVPVEGEAVTLRGSLTAAGAALPIELDRWQDPNLWRLWQAVTDADELEVRR